MLLKRRAKTPPPRIFLLTPPHGPGWPHAGTQTPTIALELMRHPPNFNEVDTAHWISLVKTDVILEQLAHVGRIETDAGSPTGTLDPQRSDANVGFRAFQWSIGSSQIG
jgi:hypothetical protein